MYLILGGKSQNSEIYRHKGSKNSLTKVSWAKVIFLKVMKFYWYSQHELISDKWNQIQKNLIWFPLYDVPNQAILFIVGWKSK